MMTQVRYDEIGTEAAPVTLTATFAGNVGKSLLALYMKKVGFNVTYVPAVTGSYCQLLLEYSQEDPNTVTPTKWKPLTTAIPGTVEVDIYAQGGTNMGTNSGTPINIPTPNTSTAAQTVVTHIMPDTDLNATFIRVRAQEKTSGAFGTLYVGVQFQS